MILVSLILKNINFSKIYPFHVNHFSLQVREKPQKWDHELRRFRNLSQRICQGWWQNQQLQKERHLEKNKIVLISREYDLRRNNYSEQLPNEAKKSQQTIKRI